MTAVALPPSIVDSIIPSQGGAMGSSFTGLLKEGAAFRAGQYWRLGIGYQGIY